MQVQLALGSWDLTPPLPTVADDGDIIVHLLSTDCMPPSVLAESSSVILSYCAQHQDCDMLVIATAEEDS